MNPERWQQVRQVFDEAVALQASERSSYLDKVCTTDPELRREVESLLSSDQKAGSRFLNTPAMDLKSPPVVFTPPTRAGRRTGAYTILEEIGHGGMGEVYRAVRADGQYTKEVAVKLVRGGFDTASVLDRFRNERQILASLDHANIARLLDGGTTDDGIPYLVMELIEGAPIDQYCDQHKLSITERLQIFRQVCAAVQYAHQRLVIHRDIKPGNVLVTKEGLPKLLDFGIAKILDPTGDAQTTMTQAMTPEYASPEQIRGETITTASDVYSLGVVLYQLLTGRSPYPVQTRTPHELARAICETEPGRPSTVVLKGNVLADGRQVNPDQVSSTCEGSPAKLQRRLDGDLDDILLMALRKEPARRYGSVEQFAEDIRRHLEGLPVIARRGSWNYRAEKFVCRHKVGMAATAVVVLAIAGGVGATIHEARLAQANALRAERRFNDVRKLANSILFEVHDAIQHLPGSTPARELIVKRALEYLDGLSQESGSDLSLKRELAFAYEKVGNVQGAPTRDNLGNFTGALDSFRKAIAIRQELVKASPGDQQLQTELARDYGEVGDIVQAMGDLKQALDSYAKGVAILAAIPQPDTKARIETEILDARYGDALSENGELDKAIAIYQQAVALSTALTRENPSDREDKRDLAVDYIHLGDGYKRMGRLQDALDSHRAAFDIFQSLVTPNNAQTQRDVAVAQERVADLLEQLGHYKEALVLRQKGLAADIDNLRADPANALAHRDVSVSYYKLANVQASMGDMDNALANERKSIEIMQSTVTANPSSAEAKYDLQIGFFHLAEILKKSGHLRDSLAAYQRAAEVLGALVKSNPKDLGMQADFSEVEMNRSDMQMALGDAAEALAGYNDALSICERVVAQNPTNSEWRTVLALIYERLGQYYVRQASKKNAAGSEWTAAESSLRRSLDIWKDLQAKRQLVAEYAAKPAEVAAGLAKCHAVVAAARRDVR